MASVDTEASPPGAGQVLYTVAVQVGKASWYGPRFHGRTTASGAAFNRYALTAASRRWRPGTLVRVTSLNNQRSAVLLVNDWGPVPADRVIDVSEAAAEILGFHRQGLATVRVEALGSSPPY
jgi:rare lipoprotein A